MNLIIRLSAIGYIILYLLIFWLICKKNSSLFNSYTVEAANEILIRYIPFILNLRSYMTDYRKAVCLFLFILYSSSICKLLGYLGGSRLFFPYVRIKNQLYYSVGKYRMIRTAAILVGITAFILLGINGVGVKEWIINSRNAYMRGRTGNGIYYILFQLSIIVAAVLYLCESYYLKKKPYKYILFVLIAYLTGSKMQILGIILIYIFYSDMFVKRMNIKRTVFWGGIGLILVVLLMSVQSNITLMEYSDYYSNFIRLLDYSMEDRWSFYNGSITLESIVWGIVPRSLNPNKPYIYGHSRIINLFYPESIILAGNTPSFSQFAIPYADFGIPGICLSFLNQGILKGFLEKNLRRNMQNNGISFNIFFTYCICFITAPVNFGLVFFIIFYAVLYFVQRYFVKFTYGKVAVTDGGRELYK